MTTVQRHVLVFDGDTGTVVKNTSSFIGAIQQLAWTPSVNDSGATLTLTLMPDREDTGQGSDIYSAASLGSPFLIALMQDVYNSNGSDTGTGNAQAPYVSAGDRVQAKVTGATSLSGRLNLWTYTG